MMMAAPPRKPRASSAKRVAKLEAARVALKVCIKGVDHGPVVARNRCADCLVKKRRHDAKAQKRWRAKLKKLGVKKLGDAS